MNRVGEAGDLLLFDSIRARANDHAAHALECRRAPQSTLSRIDPGGAHNVYAQTHVNCDASENEVIALVLRQNCQGSPDAAAGAPWSVDRD
jgi:hypothetical protein